MLVSGLFISEPSTALKDCERSHSLNTSNLRNSSGTWFEIQCSRNGKSTERRSGSTASLGAQKAASDDKEAHALAASSRMDSNRGAARPNFFVGQDAYTTRTPAFLK